MANKINLDFSSSLSQIEHLKASTEAFSNTLKGLIGEVAKFGPAVQQAMTGINSSNLQTAPLSSIAGSNADLLSQVRERIQTNQQEINDFFKKNPDAIKVSKGIYKLPASEKKFGLNRGQMKSFTSKFMEQRELKKQEIELSKYQRDLNTVGEQSTLAQDIRSVVESRQQSSRLPSGFGYDISGLPSLIAANQRIGSDESGDLKRISETIKSLQESGDKNSQIAADVLRDIAKNLKAAQSEFQQALQEYNSDETRADPERQVKAMERLTAAMEGLDRNIDQAKEAERGARQLPGGTGGGGDGGANIFGIPTGDFLRGLGKAGSVIAAGFGAVRFAQDVSIGLGRGVIGGEIDRIMTTGQMAERRFADIAAANDFTKIENIMRFRGDVITGGRSRFLGPQGFQEAINLSKEKQALEIDLLRQERKRDLFSGIGSVAVRGVAGAASGGLLFGPIGALVGGITAAATAVPGMISNYISSPATQLEGLNQGLLGTAGTMAYGPGFNKLAIEKQQALMAKIGLDNYNQARALQDAEMQRYRPLMAGYQEIMNTIAAQQEGVSLVGTYAVRGRQDIESSVGIYRNSAILFKKERDRLEDIKNKETQKYKNDMARAGEVAEENAKVYTNDATRRESPRRDSEPVTSNAEAALAADAKFRAFESSPMSYSRDRLTTNAALEMNRADFQRHRNQLTNFLGVGVTASEAQTSRMVQISRSGLGDFGTLLGNLSGLNRAVGGVDNTKTLETVLANAISVGFDKSRTAQMFAQTAISISERTGITGVGAISQSIALGAAGMSATGRPDERSLGLAAKGFTDFVSYSADIGGPGGILGTAAAFRTGLSFGKGGGILMGMSIPELQQAQEEIRTGNVTNPRTRALMRISGQNLQQLMESLNEVTRAKAAPINELIRARTGQDVAALIRNINPSNLDEKFQKVMDLALEAGSQMNLGQEGAMAFVANQVAQNASPDVMSKLNKRIKESQALFKDPAKQQLQGFIDSLTANAVVQDRLGSTGTITADDRKTYFDALKFGMSPIKVDGKDVTEDAYNEGSAAFRQKADKQLMNLSRFDIARMTQNSAALADSSIQQVKIVNSQDIGFYVGVALSVKEPQSKMQ